MKRVELIESALKEAQETFAKIREQKERLEIQEAALIREMRGLQAALDAHSPEPQKETLFNPSRASLAAISAAAEAFAAGAQVDSKRRGNYNREIERTKKVWQSLNRAEAITKIFSEARRPLHRKELTELLQSKGRNDEIDDVSAALAYLKRTHRASSLGSGRWLVGFPKEAAKATEGG